MVSYKRVVESSLEKMNKIAHLYKATVRRNLKEIMQILNKDLDTDGEKLIDIFRKTLELSTQNLTAMWHQGRKYNRTLYAMEVFPNYPEDIIELSLLLDALINVLDDLLDEELSKESRALYIIEIGRILALYNVQQLDPKILQAVSDYFNRILVMAILEERYTQAIKKTNKSENLIKSTIQLYDCLSLDFNVFVQLPFLRIYSEKGKETMEQVVRLGRILRALTLIKKDLRDVEYDKARGTRNAVLMLINKVQNWPEYVKIITNRYVQRANEIMCFIDPPSLAKGFVNAIMNQKDEIEKELPS